MCLVAPYAECVVAGATDFRHNHPCLLFLIWLGFWHSWGIVDVGSIGNRVFEVSVCIPRFWRGRAKSPHDPKKPVKSKFSVPPKSAKAEFSGCGL